MIVLKNIIWDFSDSEFKNCLYEEAIDMVCLPACLELDDLDEDSNDYEIKEYLTETYGFDVKTYELEE